MVFPAGEPIMTGTEAGLKIGAQAREKITIILEEQHVRMAKIK